MLVRKRPPYAVLTGDLIDSQSHGAEAVSTALVAAKNIADAFCVYHSGIDPKFTRFRGDGWQMVLDNVPVALRLAILIQASLKGSVGLPQTRVSIGVGDVDSMGTTSLADASGEAFVTSGRALDWLAEKGGNLAIAGSGVTHLHQIAAEFLDLRLQLWTPPQSEAAALFLRSLETSGRAISEFLGISQQAVSYRLAGADARRIAELLYEWEFDYDQMAGGPND